MSDIYFCQNQARRLVLQRQTAINGIDFLEVLDNVPGLPRQQILVIHLFRPLASATQLTPANIAITGGGGTTVSVVWAYRATEIVAAFQTSGSLSGVSSSDLSGLGSFLGPNAPTSPPSSPPSTRDDFLLVVRTNRPGDFAPYQLALVAAPNSSLPPAKFDNQLQSVQFSFKIACPTDLDCLPDPCPPTPVPTAPELDYLTKDYVGFRQLMLDRLAVVAPQLVTQNAADLSVVLVEILAHAADKMSYFQDAVATEAYLGTAQRRRSVRRHARLLDYNIGEGSNARAFVRFVIDPTVASIVPIDQSSQLLTSDVVGPHVLSSDAALLAINAGSPVFETMHSIQASSKLNQILFYTWGDDRCCLPAGSTRATLNNTGNVLGVLQQSGAFGVGTLLAFVEVLGPDSGLTEDADPHHAHVVRLTSVTFDVDPLFTEGSPAQPQRVAQIEWSTDDALPFSLCLFNVVPVGQSTALPVSVAQGNIALADHGLTVAGEDLPSPVDGELFRPTLKQGPLIWQGQVQDASGDMVLFDPNAPAASVYGWNAGDVVPAISLKDRQQEPWQPKRDLLESDALAQDFVVETEDDGSIELRFGDGTLGRPPSGVLTATYRIGNALEGNVGADSIVHLVPPSNKPIPPVVDITNPLPARGGTAPESIEHVRINAPQAFRVQKRAVTEDDYAAAAALHPDVQRAHAVRRFTGAWFTIFIAIDRFGGRLVDDAFVAEVSAVVEPLRLAGHDFVIDAARSVPLEILLTMCVEQNFLPGDVRSRLNDAFSSGNMANGQPGFFHPDNFTFGQPLYLSNVLAVATAVGGVASIDTSSAATIRFRRTDQPLITPDSPDFGVIHVGPAEVIRVDNDINQPQNGKITFVLQGGS